MFTDRGDIVTDYSGGPCHSDELYRSLFEQNSAVMLLIDPVSAAIVDANPAACSFYGYRRQEIRRLKITDINILDKAEVFREIERTRSEQRRYFRFQHRLASGEIRDVEIFSGPVRFGEETLLFSIVHDVTDRYRSESAMREAQERFRAVFEKSATGIAIIDFSRTIIMANPAFEEMFGYRRGEMTGMNIAQFSEPSDDEENKRLYHRMIAGDYDHFHMEKRYYHRTGRLVWGYLTVTLIRDAGGAPEFIVGMIQDITDRKRMEDALARAQRLESLGVLAGGIAHDFNNLLQGLLGNIAMAKMHLRPTDAAYRFLEQAGEAYERASGLTGQLLTFAQGGMPIRRVIDLKGVITETARLALSGSNVRCRTEISDLLWRVDADEGQMRQVLQNLLINAREAMRDGGEVVVSAGNTAAGEDSSAPDDGNDFVRIIVKDEGAGIPAENLPRIFDPYFTTKEMGSRKGIGLGLTVCYSIVQKHGGMITASSEPGRGARLVIYLPAIRDVARAVAPTEAGVSPRRRILVMDDEHLVVELASRYLNRQGFEVETAVNGDEAIAKYRAALAKGQRFDLIILDLTIPGGMGGVEALSLLRQADPDVYAVVSSGYANDPVVSSYGDYGFVGALIKPYRMAELGALLSGLFASDRG